MQKIRPTRLGGFSGAKACIMQVGVLKKQRNAVELTFCDAICLGTLAKVGADVETSPFRPG